MTARKDEAVESAGKWAVRCDKLEADNARLRAENEGLKAADRDHLAATNGMRTRLEGQLSTAIKERDEARTEKEQLQHFYDLNIEDWKQLQVKFTTALGERAQINRDFEATARELSSALADVAAVRELLADRHRAFEMLQKAVEIANAAHEETKRELEIAQRDAGLLTATLHLSAVQLGCDDHMVDHAVADVLKQLATERAAHEETKKQLQDADALCGFKHARIEELREQLTRERARGDKLADLVRLHHDGRSPTMVHAALEEHAAARAQENTTSP